MLRSIAGAVLALALAGCVTSGGPAQGQAEPGVPASDIAAIAGPRIEHWAAPDLLRRPPQCVLVMPFPASPDAAGGTSGIDPHAVELALARHLFGRVGRVIGPDERDRLARRRAVDLDAKEARTRFLKDIACDHYLTATQWGGGGTFLLFWSEARFGLEVSIVRARDEAEVWAARHSAARSDGGVPLSPLSAIVNAVSAARFHSDRDAAPAVVEDAVRRIMAAYP